MHLSNFVIEDGYAVRLGETWLDLHNDYEFEALHYSPLSNNVVMIWNRAAKHSQLASVARLEMRFRNLLFVRVESVEGPGGSSDAATLSFIGFLHPDDIDVNIGFLSQEEADETYHLICRFENGCTIKCFAFEAYCVLS